MSEAAPAFIPRRGFVKRQRLSLDSTALFASAAGLTIASARNFLRFQRNLSAEAITWLHF
jgi:hypothetical protein